MQRRRDTWAALGWFIGFAVAGWSLWAMGGKQGLVVDWSRPLEWLGTADLEVAIAAVARLAGLAAVTWVFSSTAAYVAGRSLGARPDSLRWLSIGPLRRAVDAVLAGSLVISSMAPAAAGVDPGPPTTAVTETVVDGAGAVDPAYIPIPAGSGRDEPDPNIDQTQPAAQIELSAGTANPGETVVVVAPGDNLWKLAEDRMAAVLGRTVSDAEVAPYWAETVMANQDRIRSGDPDLIFPGEEVLLPPVEAEE